MDLKTIYDLNGARNGGRPAPVEEAVNCYLHAIRSMEQHALEIDREATTAFQLGLRSLYRDLDSDPQDYALDASKAILDRLLRTYHETSMAHHAQTEADLREVLTIVGAAAENLGMQSEQHHSRLKQFTDNLQTASRLQELGEIRRALTRTASQLRMATEEICQVNRRSISNLQAQLTSFQERLEHAEKLAATDELTGLINRREGESRLNGKVAAENPFCLMILDLNRFKAINDRNGHSGGDQVLRIFAKKLSNLVRPSDLACRWGGDEFVVLMDSAASDNRERAARICSALRGQYAVHIMGRPIQVDVSASFGLAEYRAGDTAESLFARADEALYEHKKAGSRIN